ncbi:MAG TPA: MoxR family ATPase [Devosiaceae bacterium]|jgi:MoxR-like ATPase
MMDQIEERATIGAEQMNQLLDRLRRCRQEIGKAVIGQANVIDELLIALIGGGHVLLEGVPGVGKTLLVRTIATVAGLQFSRVQFTPDLMPADITGSFVLDAANGGAAIQFRPGPIFTQMLLADEINRATPKTQSALLEAMQEHTVTVGGQTMMLPRPLFVLATQNPIEMEGTYQLPEAQIDRFLMKSVVAFPTENELDAILDLTTGTAQGTPQAIITPADILALQELTRAVPIASHVRRAVARFVLATQPASPGASPRVTQYVRFGVSPRGAQSVVLAAKAHALLDGRYNVSFSDLQAVLLPALRHRLQLSFEAIADGISTESILQETFERAVEAAA